MIDTNTARAIEGLAPKPVVSSSKNNLNRYSLHFNFILFQGGIIRRFILFKMQEIRMLGTIWQGILGVQKAKD